MYKIGDLWAQGKIDISTEHACTNAANSLVKVINETISKSNNKHHTLSNYKIMLCTPEGELHSFGMQYHRINSGEVVFDDF
jgi:methanogenic corrinoid protein MtbC1